MKLLMKAIRLACPILLGLAGSMALEATKLVGKLSRHADETGEGVKHPEIFAVGLPANVSILIENPTCCKLAAALEAGTLQWCGPVPVDYMDAVRDCIKYFEKSVEEEMDPVQKADDEDTIQTLIAWYVNNVSTVSKGHVEHASGCQEAWVEPCKKMPALIEDKSATFVLAHAPVVYVEILDECITAVEDALSKDDPMLKAELEGLLYTVKLHREKATNAVCEQNAEDGCHVLASLCMT